MWNTKTWKFKTLAGQPKAVASRKKWIEKNGHKYQWDYIFVNNAVGIIYRPLRVIDIR